MRLSRSMTAAATVVVGLAMAACSSGTSLKVTVASGGWVKIKSATCTANGGSVTATGTASNLVVGAPFVKVGVYTEHGSYLNGASSSPKTHQGTWDWSVNVAVPKGDPAQCWLDAAGVPATAFPP